MSVASRNPFEALGEGGESPAVKAPATDASATPARRTGSDAAFRDRGAGSERNRARPTEDPPKDGPNRGGYSARVRGGRGARYHQPRDDRQPKNVTHTSDKQTAQSWGAEEGVAELKDEVAGEQMARAEHKALAKAEEESKEAKEAREAAEALAEAEAKMMSYDAYLAQQAEKKLALEDASVQVRQANEGSQIDKKWAAAKPLLKEGDGEFISANSAAAKTKRDRERKVKQVVDIEPRFVEPERTTRGGRGGRGGGRGDRGGDRGGARGGDRGDRGAFRGDRGGAPRGDRGGAPRGGGPRGDRGAPRGGAPRGAPRGGPVAAPINTNDQAAFPSLGGK